MPNRPMKLLPVIVVAGLVALAILAVVVSAPKPYTPSSPANSSSLTSNSTSTGKNFPADYIITSNTSRYLPNGFSATDVNLNSIKNGSTIDIAGITFRYVVPPTTVTTVVNGTTYTKQIDYICSSFFYAQLPNGRPFPLDYCRPYAEASRFTATGIIITTASSTETEYLSMNARWSMFELSNHTIPRVGIHVEGSGNNITAVQLVVGSISSVGGKPSCSATSGNETTCVTISDSVTESCTTLTNSIGCQIIFNGGSWESSCSFIKKGGLLYFRTVNDSGRPVQGISISVQYTTPYCPGITVMTSTQQPLATNASGWAVYDMRVAGNYSFTINGRQMETVLRENTSTYVTIGIPSYDITIVFKRA